MGIRTGAAKRAWQPRVRRTPTPMRRGPALAAPKPVHRLLFIREVARCRASRRAEAALRVFSMDAQANQHEQGAWFAGCGVSCTVRAVRMSHLNGAILPSCGGKRINKY